MGATIVEKIVRAHTADGPAGMLRAGDMVSVRPRHVLTHDNTPAVVSKLRAMGASAIHDRRQPVVVLDHDIQNRTVENAQKYARIRAFCREHALDFYPAGTGIGHQIIMDRGYALPGSLVVAADPHANTYGAVGALGTPVVRTDAAAIWATGEFWWQIPATVQVVLNGELRPGVSGKDLILTLCALYDRGEVLNAAVEFAGPGVASLSVAERMTIANMTTEWGALTGWFPVDGRTLRYLRERQVRLEAAGHRRITDAQLFAWQSTPPGPDPDAEYAARITVDLPAVSPFLAGPDSVRTGVPVAVAEPETIRVDKAYLLSCVNGRLEDLETAAAVVRGKKVADGVIFYIAAASREIQERAERSGAWQALTDAGATPLLPGCGPCMGLGEGVLEPGEIGISATNGNSRGRMGSRDARVYLASPAVVASSAIAGWISDGGVGAGVPVVAYESLETAPATDEPMEILPGFHERVVGRLVFVPGDDLNTDGISARDYAYRELSPPEMASVVMTDYDPTFAARTRPGDILVGTRNFGTGPSREQAATALKAKGIRLLIAASLSHTYERHAFNNGLPCIQCAALVHALEVALADRIAAGEATIIPGEDVEVDFRRGEVTWRGGTHRFPPLGAVPQALIVAGGVESLVRARLGLSPGGGAPAVPGPPRRPRS
jgi:homoaconitate hydratase